MPFANIILYFIIYIKKIHLQDPESHGFSVKNLKELIRPPVRRISLVYQLKIC